MSSSGLDVSASFTHVLFCWDVLIKHLSSSESESQGGVGGAPTTVPTAMFDDVSCPLFVTWMKGPAVRAYDDDKKKSSSTSNSNGNGRQLVGNGNVARHHHVVSRTQHLPGLDLRGCIGTLEPRNLHTALRDYTLNSAFRDSRFAPISVDEMEQLECTVSLLTNFEVADTYDDWTIGTHGIIIEFVGDGLGRHGRRGDGRPMYSATYLPEIASRQGWTHRQTIDSLVLKAGYRMRVDDALRKSVRVTRYQSSLCSLTYGEYAALKANS